MTLIAFSSGIRGVRCFQDASLLQKNSMLWVQQLLHPLVSTD